MIVTIFFGIAYLITIKFCPYVKGEDGHFIPLNFIVTLGVITGLIDACVGSLIHRRLLPFLISPILCVITAGAAWWICTLLPWTKDQAGVPSTNGFLTTAIILTVVVSGTAQALKE